ncbi:MAG: cyclic nucleotide-binding domain-containing protein [Syntrophomonadaceae bacterium]|nr:cyclic nucleotide-binding domain-containing protein [Syntrophomonadaceae bacterium]
MRKIKVATGIFWVEIPEAGLYVLCGCPADSVKHLIKKGLIACEEKAGVIFETGPNAILLSDLPMQNERFANLAEFPVLQMFYRQGMILPGHPNNKGLKPLLIGSENQVKAQAEYIYRGNYGLASKDEIISAGISEEEAMQMMRMKLKFAFDKILKTEELLEMRIIAGKATELRNGVFIQHQGLNQYEFSYRGETISVDLNLAPGEDYEAPYYLGFHQYKRDYFSVIHTGEGDGWDINRPCMASIIIFQGKIYLIDAGPSLLHNLQAMGIAASEIEGIFQTHAHDDHFSGLTVLLRSDHRIKYYSTPLVRASVMKKLAALTGMDESLFANYFDIRDLEADTWNMVEGLEVKPVYSPHPVETCIMFFRAPWGNGDNTYAHLADITALNVLKKMITDDPAQSGITPSFFDKVKESYLTPVSLKKIDIGGGMIHGNAEDFKDDLSNKIILSHTAMPLSDRQKVIGDATSFGAVDVLIPCDRDYSKTFAAQYLQLFFPDLPSCEIEMLLNCPIVSFNPGSNILKKGEKSANVFCILNGLLEFLIPEQGVKNQMTVGSMLAELSCLMDTGVKGTYRAINYVQALKIPRSLYMEFLRRNNLLDYAKTEVEKRYFLEKTWLFGERISCPIKSRIARAMKMEIFSTGELLPALKKPELCLLYAGDISVYQDEKEINRYKPGDFWGEESIFQKAKPAFTICAKTDSRVYRIPADVIEDIPIIQWKLLEIFSRRHLC